MFNLCYAKIGQKENEYINPKVNIKQGCLPYMNVEGIQQDKGERSFPPSSVVSDRVMTGSKRNLPV